jgi:hypothetical protein
MIYFAAFCFFCGALLIVLHLLGITALPRLQSKAGMIGATLIGIACISSAYVGVAAKRSGQTNAGNFGMGNSASVSPTYQPGMVPQNQMTEMQQAIQKKNQELQAANAGTPSRFTAEQATQICTGFDRLAIDTLIGGSKKEAFQPYQEKGKKLTEHALSLPYVRTAGQQAMLYISSFFSGMVENQYYILPRDRETQMKWLNIVGEAQLQQGMNTICTTKILDIR